MDKLEELKKKVEEALAKKQFGDAFQVALKQLIELVKGTQQVLSTSQKNEFERIESSLESALQAFRSETQAGLSDTSKKQEERINNALFTIESLVSEAQSKIDEVRDGENGMDADEEAIVARVIESIKAQPEEPEEEETGEDIVEKVNALPTNDDSLKIAIEHIKGLEDRLKRMEEYASRPSRGMTGPTRHKIRVFSLSSQCDGITKSFTMPRKTVNVLSIFGTQFPVNFDTGDFTFSGFTITLGASVGAPEAGQTLYALYESLS